MYLASHGGVFRLNSGELELVANRAQDTMGFTVIGPNHFLASGHPAPTDLDRPAHLGLIESRDAAVNWTELSRSGKADFHSLEPGIAGLYGYDALSGEVMKTADHTTWQPVLKGDVSDLAAAPIAPDRLVIATAEGLVRIAGGVESPCQHRTNCCLSSGQPTRSSSLSQATEPSSEVPTPGRTGHSMDGSPASSKPSRPARPGGAATDQGIFVSTDDGRNWTRLL